MGSPERSRGYAKRDADEDVEVNIDRIEPEDDDKREYQFSKSRKPGSGEEADRLDVEEDAEVNIDRVSGDDDGDGDSKGNHWTSNSRKLPRSEEADGLDGIKRKRSLIDRKESRKSAGGSSGADANEDDYEARKEPHCNHKKKRLEESILENLSNWYKDGEAENKHDAGDNSSSKGHNRADDVERKKSSSNYSDHDIDVEKLSDRDSRYSKRSHNSREKGIASSQLSRNSRRRRDESDAVGRTAEYVEKCDAKSDMSSDLKLEFGRERSDCSKIQSLDSKSRGLHPTENQGIIMCQDRAERIVDSERSKRGRAVAPMEDVKGSSLQEDRSSKEKFEEHRQQRNSSSQDFDDIHERSFGAVEDGNMWMRDKGSRESNRSKTPDRSGRHRYMLDNFEMDSDRSSTFRRKEQGKDSSLDDRSKGKDDNRSDRDRERANFEDTRKRRQDMETDYNSGREWEFPRSDCDWIDGEIPHGRSGGRKDGSRTDAVKTSSKYGISNENYDVIEIQTRPFDYGREEFRSSFARISEVVQLTNNKLTPGNLEIASLREEKSRNTHGSGVSGENSSGRVLDAGRAAPDQNSWRNNADFEDKNSEGQKGVVTNRTVGYQSSSSGLQPPQDNQEPGSYSRTASQGVNGSRGGRGRSAGRDCQPTGIPMPLMGPPFGPLGMPPPGPLHSLTPNMTPGPGPPISPGVFIPPFQPPVVWPGARGVEMNMLAVPPGLPPIPPVPPGPRFSPIIGNSPNAALYFNPPAPGKGMPSSMSGPNFNVMVPAVRGQLQDRDTGGWARPRTNGPPGKAPSRGEQNDYSQNFVDTGMRPQNFIRELELTSVVEDYPKLRELIQRKDEIVAKSASPPMYCKCDLQEQVLSPEFFGTKFDVILVDPPWEEYAHRASGVTDHMEYWTFEEIMNLKIEAIADTPSFIFLWVGDGVGLEQGRQCLKKWGFRRCEDICWVKTNRTNATPGSRHDSHTIFQRSKEHCLMGIRGTVRRSSDGHVIHANIDTDVIIAEEPPSGSTAKPEDMYRIIEHFSLGRRRLELFGEDHNIRAGWLTVGKGLSSSNFNAEAYIRNFADKDGKVWQGGAGRNPPPEAPHLVLTTPEIESLRPKSPMKYQQQQSASISLTASNPINKRPTGNSPHDVLNQNQEGFGVNISTPSPWVSSMETLGARAGGHMTHIPSDKIFDVRGYNAPFGPANGEFLDYESRRGTNML